MAIALDTARRHPRATGGGIAGDPQRLSWADWMQRDPGWRAAHPELAPEGAIDGGIGGEHGGGAQGEPGGHGFDYSGMTPAEFNEVAQNRANAGWLDRNMPGLVAGMIPGGGIAAMIGGLMDDRNFAAEQEKRSADFKGRGQSMPDEDMMAAAAEAAEAAAAEGAGRSGGNADAWGGTGEKEARGGAVGRSYVDRRLAPALPAFARGGVTDGAQDVGDVSGLLHSAVAGRTDQLKVSPLAGSYIVPADVVSGIGEGNTLAGARILQAMFETGPYGVPLPKMRGHSMMPSPARMPVPRAKGGRTRTAKPVPILAAGGEYSISPRDLVRLFGSVANGHKVLDAWVKHERKKIITTMSKLPGPAKA